MALFSLALEPVIPEMQNSTNYVLFYVLSLSLLILVHESYAIPSYRSRVSPSTYIRAVDSNSTVETPTNSVQRQGWTPGPDGRGTLDIIWSSAITIFLCSWTVLCLNVPLKRWSGARVLWQKFLMAGLGALGPEFILQTAIGQWASAKRSVKAFQELERTQREHDQLEDAQIEDAQLKRGQPERAQWSMTHAFFADMGGFELCADDWRPFHLDAKQVHFLVQKGYVSLSDVLIDRRVIDDKNKGDRMTRILTVGQIIWFTVTSIARLIQNLAITTLELTTLGFIICTLGSYYFWYHKPLDVRTAIPLVPNTKLKDILKAAGDQPPIVYKRTPLDFVGRDEWRSWNLYWIYELNILRKLHIHNFHPQVRPIEKISDDYVPALSPRALFILFLFHTGYAAVHIAGWNFEFPSSTEQLLWRIATLTVMVTVLGCWLTDIYTWQLHALLKRSLGLDTSQEIPSGGPISAQTHSSYLKTKIEHAASRLRNNSPANDPDLTVPLKAILPITLFAAMYLTARGYVLVDDIVNLRSQPPSVYKSVNWSNFLPHF